MCCERMSEWMMLALDGELGPTERVALEDHLARCPTCWLEWQRLQALEQVLRAAPLVPAPLGFTGRTLARLDRRRRVGRLALGGLALTAGMTAVVAMSVAPTLRDLPVMAGSLLTLSRAGAVLAVSLLDVARSVLDSLWLSLGALVLPTASLALCGLCMAMLAGLLWLTLVRRLRPATIVL